MPHDDNANNGDMDKRLVGRWLYGTKPLEYQISQEADGRLRFVGPHAGSRVSGFLQREGEWLQTELKDRNDEVAGQIRLRFENGVAISNFRGRTGADWNKDIVAQKPAPENSVAASKAPQMCQESLCLVAESTGWDPVDAEARFEQKWFDPKEKSLRHELFLQLGSAAADSKLTNPCELFAALSFQIVSATRKWQWRLFPSEIPAEGAQKWGPQNILVPGNVCAVRVKLGSDEGHGRLFHILEKRGTKVTICIALAVGKGGALSQNVWYEKRGIGKPRILFNKHGTIRDQIAIAHELRGADFDELWSSTMKQVGSTGAAPLMVLDQAYSSPSLPDKCLPASEGSRRCQEPLCLVGDFSGWSPDIPQHHFQQLWSTPDRVAVRHELCFWMGRPRTPNATEWQDVFSTVSFQIISAALDKTWQWRLYPACAETGAWRKGNILVPGTKDAVDVEHGGQAGHGRNFFVAERYGKTITICVELSERAGRMFAQVWYEHRGADAQAQGQDKGVPTRANLFNAFNLRGADFSDEWDRAMGELCPHWWRNFDLVRKAEIKAATLRQKRNREAQKKGLPLEKDDQAGAAQGRQFSKAEAVAALDGLKRQMERQDVKDVFMRSCRITPMVPNAEENFPFMTQPAREAMDQIVQGIFQKYGFQEWQEWKQAFTSVQADPDVGNAFQLVGEALGSIMEEAKTAPKEAGKKDQSSIVLRNQQSAIVAACGSQLEVGDEVMIRWQANTEGARYLTYLNGHTAKLQEFNKVENKWRVTLITYNGEFNIHAQNLHKSVAPAAAKDNGRRKSIDKPEATACVMCFDTFLESQLVELECKESHRFCQGCMRKWVRSNLVPRCYGCLEDHNALMMGGPEAWQAIVADEDRANEIYPITEKDINKCECVCEFRVHPGAECIVVGAKGFLGMRGTVGRYSKNHGGSFSAVLHMHKDGSRHEFPSTCLELDDCLSAGRLAAGKPCPAKGIRFAKSLQVASLGCACPVKQTFDDLYVLQLAMPFDWLVTRVEGVLYFFRHGFRDFCHYDDVCKVGAHAFTSFRSGYHAFPHHDLKERGAKTAFGRRATRLLHLVKSAGDDRVGRPVLLVRIAASTREVAQSEELYALLRLLGGQRIFLLVIISEQINTGYVGAVSHNIHRNLIFFVAGQGGTYLDDAVKFGMDYAYLVMHRGEAALQTLTKKICPFSPVFSSRDLNKELDFHQHWLTKDHNGLMPTSDISDCVGSNYEYPHVFFPGRFHRSGTFEASPYFSYLLQDYVKAGRIKEISALLAQGDIDVNAWDINGETVLFNVAASCNLHVCAILLLAAADPNCRSRDGRRPVDRIPGIRSHAPLQRARILDNSAVAMRVLLKAAGGEDSRDGDVVDALSWVLEPERRRLCGRLGVFTTPDIAKQKRTVVSMPKSAQVLFSKDFSADADSRGEDCMNALLFLRREATSDSQRRRLVMRQLLRDWHPDKHSSASAEVQDHAADVFCYIQGLRGLFLGPGS